LSTSLLPETLRPTVGAPLVLLVELEVLLVDDDVAPLEVLAAQVAPDELLLAAPPAPPAPPPPG
jgi:hypothetical protein